MKNLTKLFALALLLALAFTLSAADKALPIVGLSLQTAARYAPAINSAARITVALHVPHASLATLTHPLPADIPNKYQCTKQETPNYAYLRCDYHSPSSCSTYSDPYCACEGWICRKYWRPFYQTTSPACGPKYTAQNFSTFDDAVTWCGQHVNDPNFCNTGILNCNPNEKNATSGSEEDSCDDPGPGFCADYRAGTFCTGACCQ